MSMSKLGRIGFAEVSRVFLGDDKGSEGMLLSGEDLNEIDGISIWPPMKK